MLLTSHSCLQFLGFVCFLFAQNERLGLDDVQGPFYLKFHCLNLNCLQCCPLMFIFFLYNYRFAQTSSTSNIHFKNKMTNYSPVRNNVTWWQCFHPSRERKIKAGLFRIKIQVGHQSTNKPTSGSWEVWASNFTSLTLDFLICEKIWFVQMISSHELRK